jgi:phosphoserine phosphatase
MQLHNKRTGGFDAADESLATAVAAQCAVALQRSRLTEELLEKAHLDEEVELARELQMSTLPEHLPVIHGYDLHGYFLPAGRAGGDLYDLEIINEQLFILLGDATGHGFGPALSATQMQAMLRVAFRLGANLDDAYLHVNNQMTEDLPDDRFVTAFMGFLDPAKHTVAYHSGGQGPILHFRAVVQECDWYKPTNFPVGVIDIDDPGDSMVLDLAAGDLLVLLSDGIYEYHNPQGEQFGERRVAKVVAKFHKEPMSILRQHLMTAVFDFAENAPQQDDITMVLIKRQPAS